MLNLEFPLEAEVPGGTQEFLLKLRDSRLEDDMLLDEFYDKVIATYEYVENYYIILIHAMYDIPGKTSDGLEMFDASDEVYEYLLMSICPVSLSKRGCAIMRRTTGSRTGSATGSWNMPDKGFLFPAFNDRGTDLQRHAVLYEEIFRTPAGDDRPAAGREDAMSADDQKESFRC